MTFRFLQTEPAKLVATFAIDVHAATIFLHNCCAGRTHFCVQEQPFVSVFVGAAAPGLPYLNHLTIDRLMPFLAAPEAENIPAILTSCIKNLYLLIRLQLRNHLAAFSSTPLCELGQLHITLVQEKLISFVLVNREHCFVNRVGQNHFALFIGTGSLDADGTFAQFLL